MPEFSAPKGVPDYVPPDSAQFVAVRSALLDAARRAGYSDIELPIFEDTALFARGVGESTDVVSKEMYTFADRGDRSVTLRPEGTAGVVRAVIEHGLDRGALPVKLCYAGPFFRYERPQARHDEHDIPPPEQSKQWPRLRIPIAPGSARPARPWLSQ